MSQINPLTGTVIPGPAVQRQAVEKDRHLQRVRNLNKNSALQGDQLDHQVESADALAPVPQQREDSHPHRQPHPQDQSKSQQPAAGDDAQPRLDLTA